MAPGLQLNADAKHHNGSRGALKIAGISGGVFDRFRSIQDLAKDPSIHGTNHNLR
jgi:hypothetical protein